MTARQCVRASRFWAIARTVASQRGLLRSPTVSRRLIEFQVPVHRRDAEDTGDLIQGPLCGLGASLETHHKLLNEINSLWGHVSTAVFARKRVRVLCGESG
jgi:hypothetical protein